MSNISPAKNHIPATASHTYDVVVIGGEVGTARHEALVGMGETKWLGNNTGQPFLEGR